MKQKLKIYLFVGIEFLAVLIIVLLILFAGRKTYAVTFDINGGTLVSGDLVQNVRRGQTATPPVVVKEGSYLLKWSNSYSQITGDVTTKAIWEYETSYGVVFSYNGNYCLISDFYEEVSGDVYIGAYQGSYKVLGISSRAFQNCNKLTGIYLLDGILSIGDNAFEGCTNLETIVIPETVESIGAYAFKDCKNLKTIVIPPSVKSLGNGAFSGCTNLENIEFSSDSLTIGDYAFDGCKNLKYNQYDNAYYLGTEENPYSVLVSTVSDRITSCEINENTKAICQYAFSGCIGLTSITVPNSVTSIGLGAFEGCINLANISLPFVGRTINGKTNTHFGYVFGATTPTTNLMNVPRTLTTVEITGGVEIGKEAFFGCQNIINLTLPSTLELVNENAFSGCINLDNVNYNGIIENWCDIKFEDQFANPMYYGQNFYTLSATNEFEILEEIIIPETVKTIEDYQFVGFNNVTKLIISSSVVSIGDCAFMNCDSLTVVDIPSTVKAMGEEVFTTEGLEIDCPFAEEEVPLTWSTNWYKENVNIIVNYQDAIDNQENE